MTKKNKKTLMKSERFEQGYKKLAEVDGKAGQEIVESFKDFAPDFAKYLIEYSFGDIYSRQELDLRSREIASISCLVALGSAMPQLKVHINAGLNVGLTETEIKEIIMQMSVYVGFPAAINAMNVAKEVFKTRRKK